MSESEMTCSYNQPMLDITQQKGTLLCGIHTSHAMRTDPRHILFSLARYKFCAKMLSGSQRVLEVGCGDGFGTHILLQEIQHVHGLDIESIVIEDNIKRNEYGDRLTFACKNALEAPVEGKFDAVINLDVIEHIEQKDEDLFFRNIFAPLARDGVAIIGTPNITAHQYASPLSVAGHVNLKNHEELKALLLKYFENVFLFSMNDEVLHTGYSPMGHYIMALCAGYKHSKQ